jgi:hypothetical protein
MNALDIIEGVGLIIIGIWLAIVQLNYLAKGKSDTLAGHIRLLMVGIGLVVFGIIQLIKHG